VANVVGFLKKAFPFIAAGASLGGPIGTLAAAAVGKVLGVTAPEATEDGISTAIATAIQSNPEAAVQLKQAELQFQAQMQQMGFANVEQLAALTVQDRASARDMEIKTGDKWTPRVLAAVVTIGFFLVLYAMLKSGIPPPATMRCSSCWVRSAPRGWRSSAITSDRARARPTKRPR
jgi:hypothetical protein